MEQCEQESGWPGYRWGSRKFFNKDKAELGAVKKRQNRQDSELPYQVPCPSKACLSFVSFPRVPVLFRVIGPMKANGFAFEQGFPETFSPESTRRDSKARLGTGGLLGAGGLLAET